jgi:hypothetical protein
MSLDFSLYDPKKTGNEAYPDSPNVAVEWAAQMLYV